MAKRQRNHVITASFHYLVKSMPNDDEPENPIESGFTPGEFQRVLNRIRNTAPLDDQDDEVIANIKLGRDIPFTYYEEPPPALHFGDFEGAYYGQRYRNNRLGVIDADSLNLRNFHYLLTRLRDGRILVGVSYHGLFGDYDGMRKCLSFLLRGNYNVTSKTLTSISEEIGGGEPVSIKLTYSKANDRPERRPLFGSSGVLAIKAGDFGDDFGARVTDAVGRVRGTERQRKQALAQLINQGELLELDENDIVGCSAVIRENGRHRTVYFLGGNSFSTKFPLNVAVDADGAPDREQIKSEMIRVMRERILPLVQ